jgi:CheY-like chemotaxis protein
MLPRLCGIAGFTHKDWIPEPGRAHSRCHGNTDLSGTRPARRVRIKSRFDGLELQIWEKAIGNQLAVRVLVVDDFAPWRDFVLEKLRRNDNLLVIGVASDGLEAVQKAEELQPDLILLDIGLPSLNGIEVARQIRKLSPKSKILFVSQESSADVVQGALGTGAQGYVLKRDAGRELLEGVNAVLRGEQFVSARFAGHDFTSASDAGASHT